MYYQESFRIRYVVDVILKEFFFFFFVIHAFPILNIVCMTMSWRVFFWWLNFFCCLSICVNVPVFVMLSILFGLGYFRYQKKKHTRILYCMIQLINHHSFCFLFCFLRHFFFLSTPFTLFMMTDFNFFLFFLFVSYTSIADPPRKRVDTRPSKSYRTEMLANGSPIAPRRFPYGYVYQKKIYQPYIVLYINFCFFLLLIS